MKTLKILFLSLILLTGAILASSYAGTEKYGEEITNRKITKVKDILVDPNTFGGKLVTIEGKIESECSTGCWFYVKVGSGNLIIYVDTGKSGFAIPQKMGRIILVEGKVVLKKTGLMIQAKGVEIK
jgi:hypothetical protein